MPLGINLLEPNWEVFKMQPQSDWTLIKTNKKTTLHPVFTVAKFTIVRMASFGVLGLAVSGGPGLSPLYTSVQEMSSEYREYADSFGKVSIACPVWATA